MLAVIVGLAAEAFIVGDGVRLRAEPSTDGAVLRNLDRGVKVRALDHKAGGFCGVAVGADVGYVACEYLKLGSAPEARRAARGREVEPAPDDPSASEAAHREAEGSDARTLAGHRFIQSEIVPSPFMTTHFSTNTGFGFATLRGGCLDWSSGQLSDDRCDYDLGMFAQGVDLQVGVTEWLAFKADLAGTLMSGANRDGFLIFGEQGSYDYSVGVSARALGGRRWQLGVSGDVGKGSGATASILGALSESLQAGKVDVGTLFAESRSWDWKLGTELAVAASEWLGLVAAVSYGQSTSDEENAKAETAGSVTLGATADLDLHPVSPLPIGFTLAYQREQPDDPDDSPTDTLGGGLFYTGRSDLSLGLEVVRMWQTMPQKNMPDNDLTVTAAQFRMRYLW